MSSIHNNLQSQNILNPIRCRLNNSNETSTNTIALPKPGKSGEQAGGYRPISLINMCLKIVENNIMNYKHILPDNQYTCGGGSSTVDLLLKMVHDIKKSNGNASALMVDIKGACQC
ncbi:unnamed protein product [Ambrosiozyma monospora]|uniref:Unnamed protein product n=1 Tax=Ambrosiozyma monospora TaxID=43982 RepID=A0A9W6YUS7_AMBMO|nr:unnamed protein product [Ambrosiozyma monospora]